MARVRLSDHRADVRPGGPVRRANAPARIRQDHYRAVPGDRDRAGVRAGKRRALLQLLHLLRLAVSGLDVHLGAARGAHQVHRLDPRPGRLPPPGDPGRVGQAPGGGRARAREPRADGSRGRRLLLADAPPPERVAVPRRTRPAARGARRRARAGSDHRRPRLPAGAGGGARRRLSPTRRDRPHRTVDDGDPDRPCGVHPGPDRPAVHACARRCSRGSTSRSSAASTW